MVVQNLTEFKPGLKGKPGEKAGRGRRPEPAANPPLAGQGRGAARETRSVSPQPTGITGIFLAPALHLTLSIHLIHSHIGGVRRASSCFGLWKSA
jgi:hypothetical protein